VKWVAELKRVDSKNKSDSSLDVFSRARFAKNLFLFFIFIHLALLSFVFIGGPVSASNITSQAVIDLANDDRKEKGIRLLEENDKLVRAANDKAQDMIAENYFAHNSPEGVNPWHWFEIENYDYSYAGENLAMDFSSVEKMNQAWLDSPTHRANILNGNFKDIGVAVKEGVINGHETTVVVQLFGSGDKSLKDEMPENDMDEKEISEKEITAPLLPLAPDQENKKIVFSQPVITSPQEGKVISEKSVEVIGNAAPGSSVVLFDDSVEAGKAIADPEGWFRIKLDNLAEGGHRFRIRKDGSSGEREANISQQEIFFSVDRVKPKVNYQLYASNDSREYLLGISSDESNCNFELNGKRINTKERKKIFVNIPINRIASALKVEDEAGNKVIKEINLVNYFQGEIKADLVNKFAEVFMKERVFAADSGKDALMRNLGIAMERYNN